MKEPLRTWVEIDLDRLSENMRRVRGHLGERCRAMAVVKADGYGHGALAVSEEARKAGFDYLGVATLEEGLQLREVGIPVLVLGRIPPGSSAGAVSHQVRLTITSREDALRLGKVARDLGQAATVHVKLDTGMGRLGLTPSSESLSQVLEIARIPGLRLEGIFTHFACADEPQRQETGHQLEAFRDFTSRVEEETGPLLKHAANTAGFLGFSESWLDMVRIGLGLYGLYPSPQVPRTVPLEPVMAWKARVAMVKRVPAGTPISYGHTWRTREESNIATIAVGYADGYSRSMGGQAQVLVRGKRYPVVGRVCMDQSMVVLPTDIEIHPDQEVVLMGTSAGDQLPAEELADWQGTINYEIVTGMGRRVDRIFVRAGERFEGYEGTGGEAE